MSALSIFALDCDDEAIRSRVVNLFSSYTDKNRHAVVSESASIRVQNSDMYRLDQEGNRGRHQFGSESFINDSIIDIVTNRLNYEMRNNNLKTTRNLRIFVMSSLLSTQMTGGADYNNASDMSHKGNFFNHERSTGYKLPYDALFSELNDLYLPTFISNEHVGLVHIRKVPPSEQSHFKYQLIWYESCKTYAEVGVNILKFYVPWLIFKLAEEKDEDELLQCHQIQLKVIYSKQGDGSDCGFVVLGRLLHVFADKLGYDHATFFPVKTQDIQARRDWIAAVILKLVLESEVEPIVANFQGAFDVVDGDVPAIRNDPGVRLDDPCDGVDGYVLPVSNNAFHAVGDANFADEDIIFIPVPVTPDTATIVGGSGRVQVKRKRMLDSDQKKIEAVFAIVEGHFNTRIELTQEVHLKTADSGLLFRHDNSRYLPQLK